MRVAVFVPSLASMGPVILARDLVAGLKARGEEVTVYYFSEKNDITFDCPCHKISFSDVIDFDRYDILHSHGLRPDAYLFRNRRRIRGKMISTIHNYMKEDLKYTYNTLVSFIVPPLWRFLVSRHDRIVTLSRDMLEYYASLGIKRQRLAYVYNSRNIEQVDGVGIPPEDIETIRAVKSNRALIGVSASLTARKGFHQLVQLLALRTDLALVIIGSGPEQERLAQLAKDLRVSDRLLLMGYRIDAQRYFGLFDIYAMTSYSEGFPLVLIEAAHHKCRIVCSDTPLFRELFTDREVAFFKLDDISSLSGAVNQALESNDIHIRFAEVMASKYSMDAMIGSYVAVYNDALDQG